MANGGFNPAFNLKSFTTNVVNTLLIERGDVPGMSILNVAGSSDIITMTSRTLWNQNTSLVYLTSAETMELVSTSANDTSAGTGTRTLLVDGLDSNYNIIQEIVTMNGLTPVTTSNSYLRIISLVSVPGGSSFSNEGKISCTSTSSGDLQAFIEINLGGVFPISFTVPAGKTWFMLIASSQAGKAGEIKTSIHIRPLGGTFVSLAQFHLYQTTLTEEVGGIFSVSEKTDVTVRATNTSGGNASATVQLFGILIDNDLILPFPAV